MGEHEFSVVLGIGHGAPFDQAQGTVSERHGRAFQ